jgi:phage terminase large subunit-like protein
MFWGLVIVVLPLLGLAAMVELQALQSPHRYALMMIVLSAVSIGLWAVNRYRAKSAVLYFEEAPPETITTLGLTHRGPQEAG